MKVFVFDLLAYGENLDHLKVGAGAALSAQPGVLQGRRRRAHLRRASRGVGGDGPAGLRRRGLQRASLLALRPDELAQPDGRGGGAAHQAAEAPDLRQPAAAARAAAAGRGAGDARLPVERAADLGLRPRHPARVPGAQRAAGREPRALRGGLRDRHPRLDRGRVLLRGQVLVVQGRGDLAAARCSSRIRRSGSRSSAARNRSSSPAATTFRSRRGWAAAACATTSSATTPSASPPRATG